MIRTSAKGKKNKMGGVAWTEEEDRLLKKCIEQYGEGKWYRVPLLAGLNRCRKSCRLRWLNYLRPNIRRGSFTDEEVQLIIKLHKLLGNRWSLIAGRLPGRTANDVKNYWNCHLIKRLNAQAISDKEKEVNSEIITPLQPLGTSSKIPKTPDAGPIDNSQAMAEVVKEEESNLSMAFQYVDDQVKIRQEGLAKEEESSCQEADEGIGSDFGMDHLGQIHELNLLSTNHGSHKLDWDDLILDMDLWTNSL